MNAEFAVKGETRDTHQTVTICRGFKTVDEALDFVVKEPKRFTGIRVEQLSGREVTGRRLSRGLG
jgi:hypothetical protein